MRGFLLSVMAGSAVCLVAACGGDEGDGGSGGGGNAGCVPQAAECYAAGPTGPGAECLAKADNTGQTKYQGRLTSILVKAPPALAGAFVQEQVIDKGISLKQPSCFENGDGTFSWLFEIDSTTNKMKTGGSLPVTDPVAGGCFVKMPGASLPIAPIEVDVTLTANTFSAKDLDVNVPIFLSPTDTSNPIILPLHKVEIQATFNDDSHNCSGKFNGDELDPVNSCAPDTKAIPPQRSWTPGGSLKGYITIEDGGPGDDRRARRHALRAPGRAGLEGPEQGLQELHQVDGRCHAGGRLVLQDQRRSGRDLQGRLQARGRLRRSRVQDQRGLPLSARTLGALRRRALSAP